MSEQQSEAQREPTGNRPKKESGSRFTEWVQTTQGIVSIIATVITLIGGAASAAFAVYHRSLQPSPNPTSSSSSPNSSTTSPGLPLSPIDYFNQPANSAQLTQALSSPGILGSTAEVTNHGTDLSYLTGICGDSIPNGAQLTAHEIIYDAQTEQTLQDSTIEWGSSGYAAALITDDHVALDQTGGCNFSAGGENIQWTGDYPGSVPSNCNIGQYVATRVSIKNPYGSGFLVSVQCGRYTIAIAILDGNGSTVTQEMANVYMDNAMARLQAAIG